MKTAYVLAQIGILSALAALEREGVSVVQEVPPQAPPEPMVLQLKPYCVPDVDFQLAMGNAPRVGRYNRRNNRHRLNNWK